MDWYWIELRNKKERIKLLEDREQEIESIEDVLNQKQDWYFYVHEWRYYTENPLWVNSTLFENLKLWVVTVEEIKDRLADLKESLVENRIIEKLRHFDNLIAENEDKPNIRSMLIETRLALTWIDEISYLAKSDSLNSFLHLLEKSETNNLWVSETLALIWHWLNIARYYFPDKAWELLSWFKDVTSSKLFKYWEENAPAEQYMENLMLKYNLANSPNDTIVEFSKIPPAVLAWWIDWALDYVQSNIDIILVPDKIIWGLIDILPVVLDNLWELWNELVKWIENESDVAYIISYAITVIACLIYINPWIWVFTIPALVIKSLSKFNLWTKALWILEANLTKNIEKIVTKVWNSVNLWRRWYQYTSKILEKGRNVTDSINIWTKRFHWVSDDLLKSREVLKKLNNTVILADIFWKNMDKFIDKKENTNLALKVYEEEILKGNWIVLDDLEDMIRESNWELQYNLLRIREKFDEMKDIFEREIFPLIEKVDEIAIVEWFWKKSIILDQKFDFSELNELTVVIIDKYRKRQKNR